MSGKFLKYRTADNLEPPRVITHCMLPVEDIASIKQEKKVRVATIVTKSGEEIKTIDSKTKLIKALNK